MAMIKVLDMQFIRYANLFSKITNVRTNHCFEYNHTIIFVVPRNLVQKAIGVQNKNLEKLSRIIGKKIKIVAIPLGRQDIKNFVSIITRPVRFKSIEIQDDEVIINAGRQSQATLSVRDKNSLKAMRNILTTNFV